MENLFNLSIDEDYYKPIRTNSAFNRNYIKYESKGDKDKTLSIKKYLDMIRPYLSDIINDYKVQREWKVHSSNAVIDYKTQGEWKIQSSMTINFMSCKVLLKFVLCVQRVIVQRLWWVVKQMILWKNFLNLFFKNIKKD